MTNFVAKALQVNETISDGGLLTYTPPAIVGTYRIRFISSVSAVNTPGNFGWTITYTDSNGHAFALTNLALFKLGTAAPALTFVPAANDTYAGEVVIDINNAGTNIVVKTTLSAGTVTRKDSATIEQIA